MQESGLGKARQALLDALNDGTPFASFVGHSHLTGWTFDGMLTTDDATTLTDAQADAVMGRLMIPELTMRNQTIGQAIQAAKVALGATSPGVRDMLLGWTLLGDPALVIDGTYAGGPVCIADR